jgi:thiosulfate dehydrogenase (quinone)
MLWLAMVVFTIAEAVVGLFVMLVFFTRLMGAGVLALAMGILLGSGWIGTTCLDEWQIGVLGVATGFTLFLSGSSYFSLDKYFMDKNLKFTRTRWFQWLGSGEFRVKNPKRLVLTGALAIFFLTLFTNQYFHGGVYGKLHNKSVRPKIEISNATIQNNNLKFALYRVEGADVYGSFVTGIQLLDENQNTVMEYTGTELAEFPEKNIGNQYVAKVKPGKYSLVVPLGAKADLTIDLKPFHFSSQGPFTLKIIDISGLEWEAPVTMFP